MSTQSRIHPEISPQRGGRATWEEVLQFYTRSGFLYPAKLAALGERLDRVTDTWRRLLPADGDVFKMVLHRRPEEGRLVASSSVCAFEYTPGVFQIQHLVSADRHQPARTLAALLEITDWFPTVPGVVAYRLSYRRDNPGSAPLFRELGESMPAQRTLASDTTYRMVSPLRTFVDADPDTQVAVRVASPDDVAAVDLLYSSAHPAVPDWLAVSDLSLDGLAVRYDAHGLERNRTILVAEHAGRVRGTIACWWSSEGMNLSFLENAATDAFVDTGLPDPLRRRVALALVAAALRVYANRGRPYAVLVLDHDTERLVDSTRPLQQLPAKQYTNLIVSVEDVSATRRHWQRYYADALATDPSVSHWRAAG